MKLLKITTVYQAYWSKFYSKHPGLANQPYATQKEALDYDGFGWADFWSNALTPLGYEVMEISANILPLQKAWALENGVKCNNRWILDIGFEQIKRFQPTILFMEDYSTFSSSWIAAVKQACPSICLVLGWCGAPYQDSTVFNAYDLVLSCIPELVEKFRILGHQSEHINHAFDPRILERLSLANEPTIDFSFIGQIVRGNQYHSQREQILEQLAAQVPMQIYSPSAEISWKEKGKALASNILYKLKKGLKPLSISSSYLESLPTFGKLAALADQPLELISPRLQPFLRSPVFGLNMFQTLKNSKLTFNCHINISPNSASNMRLFEATGAGSCLITDWKKNIRTLFESEEIVTYETAEECLEKVQWLLENPEKRKAIAQAGHNRTLKEHTFAQRAVQLDALIKKGLKKT